MKASAIVATIWNLLPHLLAAAERKGAGASRVAGGDHHRPDVGGSQVRLHSRPALAELPGSLRTVLGVGDADLLVVLERHAAPWRSLSLRRGA